MSGKTHYQVQWVQKDSTNQPKKNQTEYEESNNQDLRDRSKDRKDAKNGKRSKQGSYQRGYKGNNYDENEAMLNKYIPMQEKVQYQVQPKPQKKWRATKQNTTYQDNLRYDSETLLSVFKNLSDVPQDLNNFKEQFPTFFTQESQGPMSLQTSQQEQSTLTRGPIRQSDNHQNNGHSHGYGHGHGHSHNQNHHRGHSEDKEPEWMNSTGQVDDLTFGEFSFKDIEQQLDLKRVKYQKDHGTYERKLTEKEEKQKQKEEHQSNDKELYLQEKEKQKQIKSQLLQQQQEVEQRQQLQQKEQKQKLQKNNTISEGSKTGNQNQMLQQLFSLQMQDSTQAYNNNHDSQNVLTVEQLEQNLKELTYSQQQQQQKNLENDDNEILNLISSVQLSQFQMPTQKREQIPDPFKSFNPMQVPTPVMPLQKPMNYLNLNEPFSTNAVLNQRSPDELLWFYIDRQNKIQGGFPSNTMDQWLQQKFLKDDLQISWLKPGLWITLENFRLNLLAISRGQLSNTKAMDPLINPQQLNDQVLLMQGLPGTTQQMQTLQQMQQIQQMQQLQQIQYMQQLQQYNKVGLQYPNSNVKDVNPVNQFKMQELLNQQLRAGQQQVQVPHINILNNVIHINPAQQFMNQNQNQNQPQQPRYNYDVNIKQQQKLTNQQQMQQQLQQQHFQQQQYNQNLKLQQLQQFQESQMLQPPLVKKLSKKEEEKQSLQQLETMFNIGIKKQPSHTQQQQIVNQSSNSSLGFVPDSNEFPSLDETKETGK